MGAAKMAMSRRRFQLVCVVALIIASVAGYVMMGERIPQDTVYHNFADQRVLAWDIPNTLDVLSNLPFAVIGMSGILYMVCVS